MGKGGDTPEGPDWENLVGDIEKFVDQNQDVFADAMKFGKNQFSKGEKFTQAFQKFGNQAGKRLSAYGKDFTKDVGKRISGLEKTGQKMSEANKDLYKTGTKTADKVTGELMPGMKSSARTGDELVDRYTKQGIPFQDEYIAKLTGWDTPERQGERAAQAVSDINMTTEAARESELRRLESFGIDPSQTRSGALDARLQAQNAVAKAQAANQGRRAVEAEGLTLGKTASDMYNESLVAGRGMLESAGQQGRNIADIRRQPGVDYMAGLGQIGEYGIGVGGLEQAGGVAGYNMQTGAENFRQAGLRDAAGWFDTNRKYGSGVYDQGSGILGRSGAMLTGAYGTSGQLNANDLAAAQQEADNSFLGGLGKLAGVAIPAIAGGPMGAAIGGAISSATSSVPTPWGKWGEGGPVDKELSPSRGAIPDDVPAFLDADEFVLDRDTVRWHGIKNLSKLKEQAQKGMGIPDGARAA